MKTNQQGFGLLETLISISVLSVVTYGVMNHAELLGNLKGKTEFDEKVILITSAVKTALNDKTTCSNFVSGVEIGKIPGNQHTPISSTMTDEVGNAGNAGVAVGGEIRTRSIVSPFRKILNPNTSYSGAGGSVLTSPSSNSFIPEPILTWDPNNSQFYQKDGVTIKKVQLVSDGYRTLLRLTFERPTLFAMGSFGELTTTQDIIIKGTKHPILPSLMDCEGEYKISDEEFCNGSLNSSWDAATKTCDFLSRLKKSSAPVLRPIYLFNDKVVIGKLEVKSTSKCECPKDQCACKCTPVPQCSSDTIAEVPPRFVVRGADILFPVEQIFGSQKCSVERHCYKRVELPIGTPELGNLLK